jgi:hypothetical protein
VHPLPHDTSQHRQWHVPLIEPLLPVNIEAVFTPERSQHSVWLKDEA